MAIKQLKNGQTAGMDSIQPELLMSTDSAVTHLTGKHPSWKNVIIIPIQKKKDLTESSN